MLRARLVWIASICCSASLAAALPPGEILDLHYHWEGKADLGQMIDRSARDGIRLGVTGEGAPGWGLKDDASVSAFLDRLQGKPVLKGLQVYSRTWPAQYSKAVLSRLDYVAADALMFPDRNGKVIALWGPNVAFPDAQDFMERYVALNVQVLAEPIDIWSNPTYLPTSLQPRYNELWTRERMLNVIGAAVKNGVAIEINSKYDIPSTEFIRLAKRQGATFTFGSNRHDEEPGDLGYCVRAAKECGLTDTDFYVPKGARAAK